MTVMENQIKCVYYESAPSTFVQCKPELVGSFYTVSKVKEVSGSVHQKCGADLLSEEGRVFGGSILIAGSHSPGGSTITSSRNSSIPASRSCLSLALYAMSWKTWTEMERDKALKCERQLPKHAASHQAVNCDVTCEVQCWRSCTQKTQQDSHVLVHQSKKCTARSLQELWRRVACHQ